MEVVRRRLREQRYSPRTEEAYVYWIRRFIRFQRRRHPKDMGEPEVSAFLSALAVEGGVAASTQNQALAAMRFLYDKVLRRPLGRLADVAASGGTRRMPVVLSDAEVRALLRALQGPSRLCAELMYGSGLRVSECLALRVKDVDLARREITVRDGKGGKDRRTPLAERSRERVERQLKRAYERYRLVDGRGIRTSGLSEALMRKLPNADREFIWQYVFASARTYVDSAGVRRRHHLDVTVVQRAVRRRAGRGVDEAGDVSRAASFVRDPPARVGRGHSDGAGASGSRGRADDDDLYARVSGRVAWCAEPGGSAVMMDGGSGVPFVSGSLCRRRTGAAAYAASLRRITCMRCT